jgi:hypothetical protein
VRWISGVIRCQRLRLKSFNAIGCATIGVHSLMGEDTFKRNFLP